MSSKDDYTVIIQQYGQINDTDQIKYINIMLQQIHTKSLFDIRYNLFTRSNNNYTTYVNDPRILAHLQKSYKDPYILLPLRDFLIVLIQNEFSEERIFKILLSIVHTSCNTIGTYYGTMSLLNSILHPEIYETVLAIRPEYSSSANFLMSNIGGFLIVQRGECAQMPDAYTVRLICKQKTSDFRSPVLLGLYLYVAKEYGQDYGLLEVGGGHLNTTALCAYDKFGFEEAPELHSDCFDDGDGDNLPMKVNLNNLTFENILDVIDNGARLNKPPHELCWEYKPDVKASPTMLKREQDLQERIASFTKLQSRKTAKTQRKTYRVSKLKTKIANLKSKLEKETESSPENSPKLETIKSALKTAREDFTNLRKTSSVQALKSETTRKRPRRGGNQGSWRSVRRAPP